MRPTLRPLVVPYIPDRGEFEKAAARLNAKGKHSGHEAAALAWLLDFLAADIQGLSSGQCDDTTWEAVRFVFDAGRAGKDYGQSGLFFQPPETPEQKMAALLGIQAHIIDVLQRYLSTGVAQFPSGEGSATIARGYKSVVFAAHSFDAGFYFMAAQLLARYGDRVKGCEGCPKLMMTGRKDQRYHSETCRVSQFMREKRAKIKAARLARQHRALKKKNTTARRSKTTKKGGKHGKKR